MAKMADKAAHSLNGQKVKQKMNSTKASPATEPPLHAKDYTSLASMKGSIVKIITSSVLPRRDMENALVHDDLELLEDKQTQMLWYSQNGTEPNWH